MDNSRHLSQLDNQVLMRAIESTTSPLIITDNLRHDNPIIYANNAFLELSGYEESDVIGHNCRFLQGDDSDSETVMALRIAVKKGKNVRVTLKNYRKDGSSFWNDLVVSPIINEKGVITHFIGMQVDITARIEYTEQLERVENSLRRSNAELEQFTYAASHDLQEPLRMVSSYLQLIDKRYSSALDEDARLFIDYAVEGAERMQALINDLLTLSRVSSTAKRFKKVPMEDILDKVIFNLKLLTEETKASIKVEKLPSLEVDSVQMVQLIQNLVGNALKYRRKNTKPIIRISAKKDGNMYTFSVVDNGIGTDPQYHERIFTIFQRLHTREEYPGTGVGLAICSKIIDRHDGKIWVESNNEGSTFKFSLPIKRKATA